MKTLPLINTETKIARERAIYAEWATRSKVATFDVPENNLAEFEKLVASLNKKAARLNTKPITIKRLGFYVREHDLFEDQFDIRPEHVYVRYWRIIVMGETPQAGGWRFVAVLQHTEAGNLLRVIPGAEGIEIPDTYRNTSPMCEHCAKNRRRKDTYLLMNRATGEFKQVGSNCLRDFTGQNDPHRAAKIAGWFDEILHHLRNMGDGGGEFIVETVRFLARVVQYIRQDGWVSRGEARESGEMNRRATADRVWDDMIPSKTRSYTAPVKPPEPTESDVATALAALEWVRAGMGKSIRPGVLSDYEHNLIVACAGDHVGHREIGIVASAIRAYAKSVEDQVAREQAAARTGESGWVGQPKQRQMFTDLRCVMARELESQYGVTVLHKFEDAAGNVFVWFASRDHLVVGATYSGDATVKGHDSYQGVKQTTITRCKFIGPRESEPVVPRSYRIILGQNPEAETPDTAF